MIKDPILRRIVGDRSEITSSMVKRAEIERDGAFYGSIAASMADAAEQQRTAYYEYMRSQAGAGKVASLLGGLEGALGGSLSGIGALPAIPRKCPYCGKCLYCGR